VSRVTTEQRTAEAERSRPRGRRGAETRRRIEAAAARLFTRAGYPSTTMQAIADDAGVHVQTIYLAYRTKAALLAACAARLVAGDEEPDTHPSERRWAREVAAERDPRAKLARYVRQIGEVSPRITPLLDALRATAPDEPEVAEFMAQMEDGRREGPRQLLGLGVPAGTWRAGLGAEEVADIVFALASPDTLRALVGRCAWDPNAAQALIVRTLERELMAK
jgi:AcrR family transcriptional regulator